MFFNDAPLTHNPRSKKKPVYIPKFVASVPRVKRDVQYFTDMELSDAKGATLVYDSECYKNYWSVAFKCVETKRVVYFELSACATLDKAKLEWVMKNFRIVSFNGKKYDNAMIWCAIRGWNNTALKTLSDDIVKNNYTAIDLEREHNIRVPRFDDIDLFPVAPVNKNTSLKKYAARLHAKRLQDLPYAITAQLTQDEADHVKHYCINDLDNTLLLWNKLQPEIRLRIEMSVEYGIDLRSFSDAQIAEKIFNSELKKITGKWAERPKIKHGYRFQYQWLPELSFELPQLKQLADDICESWFGLNPDNNRPQLPSSLEDRLLTVGNTVYAFGMGGLHSQEKSVCHTTEDGKYFLIDIDAASFYPTMILNQRLFPKHLGEAFLIIYRKLVERRLKAKPIAKNKEKLYSDLEAAAAKVISDSIKVTINGSFGKLGDPYSTIFAPELMVQITISGQLWLLKLIEMMTLANINVVSGNTDGIIVKVEVERRNEMRAVIKRFEQLSKFDMEETYYKGTYSKDVNNYFAVYDKPTGPNPTDRYKVKGIYCERGSTGDTVLSKDPETLVCSDAAIEYILTGKPLEQSILECKDIRRFVQVAASNNGIGMQKGEQFLGKVVRWYFAEDETGHITNSKTGGMIPDTTGGKPLMDMPDELPTDLDYNFYVERSTKYLQQLGVLPTIGKQSNQAALF